MATETSRAIEAILMVAEGPVDPQLLAQLLEVDHNEVEGALQELMASYEVEDRGFILTKVAGGYRYQSHPEMAPYVERFVLEGQTARLSAAALETLAIVAYKQPISRAQVAAIRGVSVDGVIRTLEQRGYIAEIARDPGPGNPSLFGTTHVFLEKLGLDTIDDLPPIAAFVPGPDVVEQLEQGLRAEIDPEVVAEVEGAAGDTDPDTEHDGAEVEATDAVGVVVLASDEVDAIEVDEEGDLITTVATEVVEIDADGVVTDTVTTDVEIDAPDGSVIEVIETDVVAIEPDGSVIEVIETDVVAVGADGSVIELIDVDVDLDAVVADDDADAEDGEDGEGSDDADDLDGDRGRGDADPEP